MIAISVNLVFIVGDANLCVSPFFGICHYETINCLVFFLMWPTSLGWSFPSSILYRAVFVARDWLNFVL